MGPAWRLCVIVGTEDDPARTAEAALRGGAGVIQYRGKGKAGAVQLRQATALRELTRRYGAFLIINDRSDIASLADADGVHLGTEDLPVAVGRRILGEGKIIGATAHSLQEALEVQAEGADYVGLGSVFPTPSKAGARVIGLETLREVTARVRIAVVGIGGIARGNAGAVLQQGARGVAVLSAVGGAPDPEQATRALLTEVKRFSLN
jgi:thiamine-phosphate diphosphorylase